MGTEGQGPPRGGWVLRVLIGRDPKRTMMRAVIWAGVLILISKFVLLPIRLQGPSMLPTYKENGVNFVNCLAYVFHPPRRGDVVAVRLPAGQSIMYCKRIIALPGETIAFHHGEAVINGRVLDEPYVKQRGNWERDPEKVGPDEYYFVGDNRGMDFVFHDQGRAGRKRIVGKILL
jgi:signal peptidase I